MIEPARALPCNGIRPPAPVSRKRRGVPFISPWTTIRAGPMSRQESDPDSLLNFVRRLTRLRKSHPALGSDGTYRTLFGKSRAYPFIYERTMGEQRFIIALNPSAKAVETAVSTLDGSEPTVVLSHNKKMTGQLNSLTFTLDQTGFAIVMTKPRL
jgi:glycosidase